METEDGISFALKSSLALQDTVAYLTQNLNETLPTWRIDKRVKRYRFRALLQTDGTYTFAYYIAIPRYKTLVAQGTISVGDGQTDISGTFGSPSYTYLLMSVPFLICGVVYLLTNGNFMPLIFAVILFGMMMLTIKRDHELLAKSSIKKMTDLEHIS